MIAMMTGIAEMTVEHLMNLSAAVAAAVAAAGVAPPRQSSPISA
jgi:hypothetical protein